MLGFFAYLCLAFLLTSEKLFSSANLRKCKPAETQKKKSGGAPEPEIGPRPNAELLRGGVPGSPAAVGRISSRARPDPARRRPAGGGLEGAIRPPRAVIFFFCLRQWRDRNSLVPMGKKSSRKSPLGRRRTTPKQPAGAPPGTLEFAYPTTAALSQGIIPAPPCQGDCGESSNT